MPGPFCEYSFINMGTVSLSPARKMSQLQSSWKPACVLNLEYSEHLSSVRVDAVLISLSVGLT